MSRTLHAPELWACALGSGRSWPSAHAWGSGHTCLASVLSVSTLSKKVSHHCPGVRFCFVSPSDIMYAETSAPSSSKDRTEGLEIDQLGVDCFASALKTSGNMKFSF